MHVVVDFVMVLYSQITELQQDPGNIYCNGRTSVWHFGAENLVPNQISSLGEIW